jgi:hypothetical protein
LVKAISPLLRSEFAQSTPAARRTAISRTVSSLATKEPFLEESIRTPRLGDPCSGRSAIMQSNHSTEPRDSTAPRAGNPVARLPRRRAVPATRVERDLRRAARATATEAQRAATDVHLHAGAATGIER